MRASTGHPRRVFGTGLLVCDTLIFLDSYPGPDEKRTTRETRRLFGGPASNALAFLARSGVETHLLAAVGSDDTGNFVCNGLKAQGVNTGFIRTVSGAATSQAYILIEKGPHGKRTAILAPDDACVPEYNPAFIDAMHPGDILLAEGRYPAEADICRAAHEKGVTVVLDPGTRIINHEQWREFTDYWLAPKQGILNTFGEIDLFNACRTLAHPPVKFAVVTLGPGGAVYGNREISGFQPVFPVDARETNGCGDIFHAGFIWGLLNNMPLPSCVEFGAASGAMAAEQITTHSRELTAQSVRSRFTFRNLS